MLALTHLPSPQLARGERTFIPEQEIDPARAAGQHAAYCRMLAKLGLSVRTLDVNVNQADSVFIEDTAVVLDEVAILAAMGAASREPEPAGLEPVLREYRPVIGIRSPAMLEGGDVLRIGRTVLVGLSRRTNRAGIAALAEIVSKYGYSVETVPVRDCLHLKTACTALPDGRLLVNSAWLDVAALGDRPRVEVPADEPWAANVLPIGERVCLPAAHVRTADLIVRAGYDVQTVELSEFAKAEGGITCLSLLLQV